MSTVTLVSFPDLKKRGWTEAAVRRFLGEPDKLKTNPRFSSAAPMRLYDEERVQKVEASEGWTRWRGESAGRSMVAKSVTDRKRQETLDWVDALDIDIPVVEASALLLMACNAYNSLWESRRRDEYDEYETKSASEDDDQLFLQRITVNFLRHECSDYESELYRLHGRVGVRLAEARLRDRILRAIGQCYPSLDMECLRQKR